MTDTAKPHTERWAYRRLYSDQILTLCTRLYPFLGRLGFQFVSRTVAAFYAATQPTVRETVRRNLALLDASATGRDAFAVFLNYAATIADYVAVGAAPEKQVERLFAPERPGIDYLTRAAAEGRGVILATAHFSFFEFGTVVLGQMGLPLTVATLPEPSEALTEWRARWRRRWQAETVAIGADPFSSVQLIRALEAGRCVALLADRPIAEHGLPVDLPHGRIAFSTAPALLASMAGCPIVPVTITRLPGAKYRLAAKPPIHVEAAGREDRRTHIENATRRLAAALLEDIEKTPTQWYQFVPVGL